MMKNVKYDRDMRERAKRDGKPLVTIAWTHKNGKNACVFQGPATEQQVQAVADLVNSMISD